MADFPESGGALIQKNQTILRVKFNRTYQLNSAHNVYAKSSKIIASTGADPSQDLRRADTAPLKRKIWEGCMRVDYLPN